MIVLSGDAPPHPATRRHVPSMTEDYSRVSETARAIEGFAWPRIAGFVERAEEAIADLPPERPFVVADYGAADGANSSRLFERVVARIRETDPARAIRLVYVDIADPAPFERFRATYTIANEEGVEARYVRSSFYGPVPALAGAVHLGYSSTALHWLDTSDVGDGLFRHPACIQPSQLPEAERAPFAERWRRDWRRFLVERSREMVPGGMLLLSTLTNLGGREWPASAAYDNLRDVCAALHSEGRISDGELQAIFVPSYFATPDEMRGILEEKSVRRHFTLRFRDAMTVPCAYFSRMGDGLETDARRRNLAETLARVVRAWSESSIRAGLSADHADLVDEVYDRLAERFCEAPAGLPYQYCLIELERVGARAWP